MKKYVMALDQGTTSSRCILFNHKGEIESVSQKEFTQIFPKPGWVEHDPMEIWSTQIGVAFEACEKLGVTAKNIAGIGITNQRETTIVWNKNTGLPIYNAIVWQCRRTAPMIDKMDPEMKKKILRKTGLIPDAYFSATKIKWILDNVKGAKKLAKDGQLLFGTVDTWLMWNLSGRKVHATDYTNASRTMLFDIKKLCWDKELLDYFGIPMSMMPEVHPSGYLFGYSETEELSGQIPICGVAGDQQASLFGLCGFNKGDVKNTYGTGCFLLMNTGNELIRSKNGLLTTIAASRSENVNYVLEGSIFIGGAVIQWLRDEMEFFKSSGMCEEVATSVKDTEGAYFVPAFTGLGAPHWNQDARGTLVGATRGFNKANMTRACLEAIAYQTHDVIKAMEQDAKYKFSSVLVDGGASKNNFLMQFQSDLVDSEIQRPKMVENTALGAAYLAGLTVGYWKDEEELKKNQKIEKRFKPAMENADRNKKIKGWNRAVKTAKFWADNE